jgi:hypothetical protein
LRSRSENAALEPPTCTFGLVLQPSRVTTVSETGPPQLVARTSASVRKRSRRRRRSDSATRSVSIVSPAVNSSSRRTAAARVRTWIAVSGAAGPGSGDGSAVTTCTAAIRRPAKAASDTCDETDSQPCARATPVVAASVAASVTAMVSGATARRSGTSSMSTASGVPAMRDGGTPAPHPRTRKMAPRT